MATTYSTEATGPLNTTPATFADAGVVGGRMRRFRSTITLAAQASGDVIVLFKRPANYRFSHGLINTTDSLGTSTVKIGTASSDAAYRALATFTATDTPTTFGKAATVAGTAPTSAENVVLTIATAALPASGTLVVDCYFSAV